MWEGSQHVGLRLAAAACHFTEGRDSGEKLTRLKNEIGPLVLTDQVDAGRVGGDPERSRVWRAHRDSMEADGQSHAPPLDSRCLGHAQKNCVPCPSFENLVAKVFLIDLQFLGHD